MCVFCKGRAADYPLILKYRMYTVETAHQQFTKFVAIKLSKGNFNIDSFGAHQ